MSRESHITTFQFLEKIQGIFVSAQSSEDAQSTLETRRVVNFFDNTAALHVLSAQETQALNGSATPLATLSLQSVSKEDELPTFAVHLACTAADKSKKQLILIQNDGELSRESQKLVSSLEGFVKDALAAKQAAEEAAKAPEQPAAQAPQAEAPAAEQAAPSAEAPEAEGEDSAAPARSERLSRRSRLRSRESSED